MKKPFVIVLVAVVLLGACLLGAFVLYRTGFFMPTAKEVIVMEVMPAPGADSVSKEAMDRAVTALERRVNWASGPMVGVNRIAVNRIEIRVPIGGKVEGWEVRSRIERMGRLDFRLVHSQGSTEGFVKMPVKQPNAADEHELLVKDHADLEGKYVKQTYATLDPSKGWEILLKFDEEGGKLFAALTAAHAHERLAVVVDGEVITAPNLVGEITGGVAEISGGFTEASASELAELLDTPLENQVKIISIGTEGPAGPRKRTP